MIGTAIRKYAEAHGMTCDGGYAYGKVNGRHIAMLDSYGVKMLQIYLYPPARPAEKSLLNAVRETLTDCDPKEYRLIRQNAVNVGDGRAVVIFQDNPGTIKRMERYIDEIMPKLDALELDSNACAFCGRELGEETAHTLLDDYVLPLHEDCVGGIRARSETVENRQAKGSLAYGVLGALLGAFIGAIPWAVMCALGYVAGFMGLLIGYLANLLYGKMGGRNTRVRAAIVVAAMICGVILGQIAGTSIAFTRTYEEKGGADVFGMTRSQYIATCWDPYFIEDQTLMLSRAYDRLRESSMTRSEFIDLEWNEDYSASRAEALRELVCDMSVGLLFGVIGSVGMFFQMNRKVRPKPVRRLK